MSGKITVTHDRLNSLVKFQHNKPKIYNHNENYFCTIFLKLFFFFQIPVSYKPFAPVARCF